MRFRSIFYVVLLLSAFSRSDEQSDRQALYSALNALNIFSGNNLQAQPFQVKARLKLLHLVKGEAEGEYKLIWISPQIWRREISLPAYQSVIGASGGVGWAQDSQKWAPIGVIRIEELRTVYEHLAHLSQDAHVSVKGGKNTCLEVKEKDEPPIATCFNSQAGTAHSVDYEGVHYEFYDYHAIGGRNLPTRIRASVDGSDVAELSDIQTSMPANLDPAQYPIPSGAREFSAISCDLMPGHLVNKVQPAYPAIARTNRRSGDVVFGAMIDQSGRITELSVLQTAGSVLDHAAFEAVKQWRYIPALCRGNPIPVQTTITVRFRLGGG